MAHASTCRSFARDPDGSGSEPGASTPGSASSAPYRLTLLGAWDLHGPEGERIRSVLSQPKRLCLLAYLAMADGPVSRAHLVALFWPESDEERARNALSHAVHYLRRSLTKAAVASIEGDRLEASADWVACDAAALLAGDDPVVARDSGQREFFEGWNAEDSQPLQDWRDGMRRRVRERVVEAGVSPTARSEGEPDTSRPASADPVPPTSFLDAPPRPRQNAWWAGPRPGRRRLFWLLAAVLGRAILIATAQLTQTANASADSETEIVVLLPTILTSGSNTPFPATSLREEVVAVLTPQEVARVVWSPFSDLSQLVRIPGRARSDVPGHHQAAGVGHHGQCPHGG
jgi:hypothetical protein